MIGLVQHDPILKNLGLDGWVRQEMILKFFEASKPNPIQQP